MSNPMLGRPWSPFPGVKCEISKKTRIRKVVHLKKDQNNKSSKKG